MENAHTGTTVQLPVLMYGEEMEHHVRDRQTDGQTYTAKVWPEVDGLCSLSLISVLK